MARPSNTEHRRQEIISGLMQAMAQNGYEKASIQSIGKAAGLTPGLIHYHFKSKLEILIALVQQLSQLSEQRYQRLATAQTDAKSLLMAYVDAMLSVGSGSNREAVAAWVIIGSEAVRLPEVRAVYQSIINKHRALLEDLIQSAAMESRHKITSDQAKVFSLFTIASIEGAFQLATTVPGSSTGQAATVLKQALWNLMLTA